MWRIGRTEAENNTIGEVLWIVDKEEKSGRWKIGRVEETFSGKYNRNRVVMSMNRLKKFDLASFSDFPD